MLNMKKGLALVLAAATAFTFAPVSTLGLPVAAYADENQTTPTTVWSGTLETGEVYSFNLNATESKNVTYALTLTYGNKDVTVNIENGKYYNIPDTEPTSIQGNDTITGAATATNATTSPSAAKTASIASTLLNEVTANAAETKYDYVGAKITATGVKSGESVSVSVIDNGEANEKNNGKESTTVDTKHTVVAGDSTTSRTGDPDKALKDALKIPVTAFGNGDGKGTNKLGQGASIAGSILSIDGVDSITRLSDGSGFFISGLKLQGDKNAEYTLADAAGLTFFQNGSQAVTKNTTKDTLVKSLYAVGADKVVGRASSDGVLTVDVYVSSSGDHKFTLANDFKTGQGNKQNAEIKFNISADDMQLIEGLDIEDAAGNSMKNTDNGLYELTLNDGDRGYDITGLDYNSGAKVVRTWTGVDVKSHVKVQSYNARLGYLEATGSIIDLPWYEYGNKKNVLNADGDRYSIKAGNVTTAPVEITVAADNNIAVAKLKVTVDRSNEGIDSITYTDVAGGKITANTNGTTNSKIFKFTSYETDSTGNAIKTHPTFTLTGLNKQVNNKGSFSVKAESGKITYRSEDSSIVSINDDGTFTVQGVGKTTIHITSDGTVNNKAVDARINVEVEDWAWDIIDAKFDDSGSGSTDTLYLDVAGQKNGKPVFTGTLHVKSYGSLPYKVSTASTNFSISDDGNGNVTVKSGSSTGEGTITVSTTTDTAKRIHGTSKTVYVIVWDVPAAEYTKTDVVLAKGQSELLGQYLTVTNPNPSSVRWDYGTTGLYTLSNPENGGLREVLNNQTTSRITATAAGQGTVKATIAGVAGKTRPTVVSLNVAVTDSSHANVIVLGDTKSLTLTEGDAPVTVTASSTIKADVAFASSDPTVATVAAGATSGSAIVTAVKAGKTTIKVTSEGAETVEIPVIVSAKTVAPADTAKKPAKVTGVKITNKKGGFVTVTWNKQNQKNVKYYVKKTVGKKSSGKSVGSNKATLSVKKGATVKVKVKAYIYDATGKKLVGSYSKTVTKKTDKK